MILINKNSSNTVDLTLYEKQTLNSPVFLFRFINDTTRQQVTFIAQDISSYRYRYNRFTITETSGTNYLASGIITLNPVGFWRYEVYEQTSATSLNVAALSSEPLETGKVKVVGTGTEWKGYEGQSNTYKAYEG